MNKEIEEILDDLKNTGYEKLAKNIENIIDYITNLQQELEEEKRINQEDLKYIDKLQERIDKAIEYIENDTFKCKNQEEQLIYDSDLLNILRGKDNE